MARRAVVIVLAILYGLLLWPVWAARDFIAGFREGRRRGPVRIRNLFSRKRWRIVQRCLRVHRIHHPLWSFGWAFPFGWVRFEARVYKDHLDGERIKTWPAHWKRCPRGSTASGVY